MLFTSTKTKNKAIAFVSNNSIEMKWAMISPAINFSTKKKNKI
jgi:hypothetical protein